MAMNDMGKEIGWDETIENEGEIYEPLPEGVYRFVVNSMDRGRYPGGEKMSACPTANLDLVVTDEEGRERHVFDTLYLNTKSEWRLSQFFLCIGQKKKGEPLRPNWGAVAGSSGRFEIYVNEYTDKEGRVKKNNRVDKYLPFEEKKRFEAGKF